jgi:hypothetical protein
LFSASQEYNEDTLRAASDYVTRTIDSNLGGTELLAPLADIFAQQRDPDYPRVVFLLTDGEVTNTEQVLKSVKKSTGDTRVFTFGIGADASKTLVSGIAKFGNGRAEYVRSGERLEAPVMRTLKKALQPPIKNVSIDWDGLEIADRPIPFKFAPVFGGSQLVVTAFLQKGAYTTVYFKVHDGDDTLRVSGASASLVLWLTPYSSCRRMFLSQMRI